MCDEFSGTDETSATKNILTFSDFKKEHVNVLCGYKYMQLFQRSNYRELVWKDAADADKKNSTAGIHANAFINTNTNSTNKSKIWTMIEFRIYCIKPNESEENVKMAKIQFEFLSINEILFTYYYQ